MVTRQDIADALSTLPGITGQPLPPRVMAPGIGWPEWTRTEPLTATGDRITWAVHVTLPAGSPEATVMEADALTGALLDALYELGEIQTLEPTTVIVQQGGAAGLPCLTATLTTVY
jgi:hypothetical protein